MAKNEGIDFNFEDKGITNVRLDRETVLKVHKAVELYSGLYSSKSHFIRCAINRELRRLETSKPEMEADE